MPYIPSQINTIEDLIQLFSDIQTDMPQLAGFIYGSEEELLKVSRDAITYPVLLLDHKKMFYDENKVDYMANFQPVIYVLKNVKPNNRTEQTLAESETQLIIEEILARLDYYSKKYSGKPPFSFNRRVPIQLTEKFSINNEFGWQAPLIIRRTKNVRWTPNF